MISDIFPTAYYGAELAEVSDGDTVAVFGCGPVGQFAIASALIMGAGMVFVVDKDPSRLEMSRAQGAITVNFDEEEPVETIQRLTGGIGVDRAIEAVGVDAERATSGPAAEEGEGMAGQYDAEMAQIAPETNPQGDNWHPGGSPSQSLNWAAQAVAKAGTIGIIGVFPPQQMGAPVGLIQQRNLTVKGGNCNHRKYIPKLVGLVATGALDPTKILTQQEPMTGAIEAYETFDRRRPGWIKVELEPAAG